MTGISSDTNTIRRSGFGKSEQCALTKTIEYYTGTIRRGGPAGTGHYDRVYTSNAWGQPEKTYFIDPDDSTTRSSTRLYTWRQKLRRVTHPNRFGPFRWQKSMVHV